MRLTKELVLARSGNCDLESIFHLDLSGLRVSYDDTYDSHTCIPRYRILSHCFSVCSQITDLGDVLNLCPYLIRLDLSRNEIVDISSIEMCKEIQWLNLSDNANLRDIEPLTHLLSLTSLLLVRNSTHASLTIL